MEIIPLTPEHRSAWDNFCRTSPDAWFWHTTPWIDYNLAYRPELEQRSLSFLCKEGDKIIAAVPLLLGTEQRNEKLHRIFSFSGNPVPAPALAEGLSESRRVKLFESLFELIEGLAVELGVAHSHFQIAPLSSAHLKPKRAPHNFLLRYHYLDCSIATQMIDLRLSEQELWAGVRRDHQRNIEKARESLTVRVHAGSVTDEKFDEYRLMHARAAGRVRRPLLTFHMMRDWIRSGGGFLAEALLDGRSVGFEIFQEFNRGVYSMSACNEPGFGRLPIRHLLQWESIRWMKARSFEFYEVGNQQFGSSLHDFPDQKQIDISLFKSGFGGATVPYFYGERFHTKERWESDQLRRAVLFAASYAWKTPADAEQARALLRLAEEAGRPRVLRPEESAPIPESARALAAEVARNNPDAVQSHRNGSTKAVAFLVGGAMQKAPKGLDARLVRRAIEEHLAQVIAVEKQT